MKAIDSLAPARLKLAPSPSRSLLPSSLYLDHSHCLVLAPATLAALPSTRAIPDREVFYVARPARSILPSSFSFPCPELQHPVNAKKKRPAFQRSAFVSRSEFAIR